MTSPDTPGLLDQGDLGETTAQQFTCDGEAGDASTDNADAMYRTSSLGNAAQLFDETSVVETQVRRVRETCGPWQHWSVRLDGKVGGMVVR